MVDKEKVSESQSDGDTWYTVDTDTYLDPPESDSDSGPTGSHSLDDTLPFEVLPEEISDIGLLRSEAILCNRTYIIYDSKAQCLANERSASLGCNNLKMPECSTDFQPVCCSSRLSSLGRHQSDTNPYMCSRKSYLYQQEIPTETVLLQRQSSEFNPPLSSTCHDMCSYCAHGKKFDEPLIKRCKIKSDISEFDPPLSSTQGPTKTKLDRRFQSGTLLKAFSDGAVTHESIKNYNCDYVPQKPFSYSNSQKFDKCTFQNFDPEFHSTACTSELFMPLKCSSAVDASLVFNPPMSSTVQHSNLNVTGLENLKLHSIKK